MSTPSQDVINIRELKPDFVIDEIEASLHRRLDDVEQSGLRALFNYMAHLHQGPKKIFQLRRNSEMLIEIEKNRLSFAGQFRHDFFDDIYDERLEYNYPAMTLATIFMDHSYNVHGSRLRPTVQALLEKEDISKETTEATRDIWAETEAFERGYLPASDTCEEAKFIAHLNILQSIDVKRTWMRHNAAYIPQLLMELPQLEKTANEETAIGRRLGEVIAKIRDEIKLLQPSAQLYSFPANKIQ